jgi:hypothetical protein
MFADSEFFLGVYGHMIRESGRFARVLLWIMLLCHSLQNYEEFRYGAFLE